MNDVLNIKFNKIFENLKLEVSELLPSMPKEVGLELAKTDMIRLGGVLGYTPTRNKIVVKINPDFTDKFAQIKSFENTVYHELYHIAQGWSYDNEDFKGDALDNIVEEGMAEHFASTYKPVDVSHLGDISDDDLMRSWYEELMGLGNKYLENWQKYKFYDEENDRSYMIYRVGEWVARRITANNPNLSFDELAKIKPARLIELANT